jgi:hypothetical protein
MRGVMESQVTETTVPKVVSYILFDWLTKRMNVAKADVTLTMPTKAMFLSQYPPLQFKSQEVILGRHYSLELHKEPYVYWMKELSVTWLPHLDAQAPPDSFLTTITNKVVPHPTGFYRVISEVSEDHEYLVRLQIIRV